MNNNIREQIGHALGALADGDFVVGARDLLAVLGYESTRTLDISGRVNEFISQFPAPNENTQTEQVFRENARSVRILFQVTDTEITVAQRTLLPTDSFDSGNARSFLCSPPWRTKRQNLFARAIRRNSPARSTSGYTRRPWCCSRPQPIC